MKVAEILNTLEKVTDMMPHTQIAVYLEAERYEAYDPYKIMSVSQIREEFFEKEAKFLLGCCVFVDKNGRMVTAQKEAAILADLDSPDDTRILPAILIKREAD